MPGGGLGGTLGGGEPDPTGSVTWVVPGPTIVMSAGTLVVVRPSLSVATAVRRYVPGATWSHAIDHGAADTLPRIVAFA